MVDKLFVATKAVIVHQGRVLLLQESSAYADGTNAQLFDVPGGRLKPGESVVDCLRREVFEETGLKVVVESPLFVGEWRPTVHNEQLQIVGIFFLCRADDFRIKLSADHDQYQWIDPKQFKEFPIIPNLIPMFEVLLKKLG